MPKLIGQGNGPGAGAIPATSVSVDSATKITATTGGGAKPGAFKLFVKAPDGSISLAVALSRFTYTGPEVSSVSPGSGPVVGGTPITINGSGFAAGDMVLIGQGNGPGAGAIPATDVMVVSATEITATTGGGARPGAFKLFVKASDGSISPAVALSRFTYTA